MSENDVQEDEELEGEISPEDEIVSPISYDVTSYGSDPEVESLVNRLRRDDIIIPHFQRDYVWRHPEASKFIESLLLGLPVPGVFFATDPTTNKQLVIDGQQRLKTLLFFYNGVFNPRDEDKKHRIFKLIKVQEAFEGKTYKTLEEPDRIRLDTSIMHATTVKQSAPPGNDTSLYHIFERLNSGGRRLTDQEMRAALYHGELIDRIRLLNTNDQWRNIFGKVHTRLKDQELILRFFAFFEDSDKYQRSLSEFLNKYAARHQNPEADHLEFISDIFRKSIDTFSKSLNGRPFRPNKSINVAVYDSCMVGIAKRIATLREQNPDPNAVAKAYQALLSDGDYNEAVSSSTGDTASVQRRIQKATEAFAEC